MQQTAFIIYVSVGIMEEIREHGIPDELHGSCRQSRTHMFGIHCPVALWNPQIVSGSGDIHLKKRPRPLTLMDALT